MKKTLAFGIGMIALLILVSITSARPQMPTEFYGNITFYNNPAPLSGPLIAYEPDGDVCGNYSITTAGYYGVLSCNADDPDTPVDEGAEFGNNITFLYNTLNVSVFGSTSFSSGSFRFVEIVVPRIVCGDGFCDNYESTADCPADCPPSQYEEPPTEEPTEGGGGGGGGGGTGAIGASGGFVPQKDCKEKWNCGPWGKCMPEGKQYRECIDENNCGTTADRPDIEQACIYIPTCFDGIKNQGEEDIDCGGPCPPCHCRDGIQNYNETGIDCGGECPACPSCFDGIQNCHKFLGGVVICEEGVDCGGPCEKKCPKRIIEMPLRVCIRVINPFNIYFLLVILLTLTFIGIRVYLYHRKIMHIKTNKEIEIFKRAKMAYEVERKMYLFLVSCGVVLIILLFYYYFFGICEQDNVRYLWLLGVMLVLAPVAIHRIMKYFEYSEKKKLKQMEMLSDTHYHHISSLIKIETDHLMELENEITDMIGSLVQKKGFKDFLEKEKKLKKIYNDMLRLYDEYKENKRPYKDERMLCNEIYAIEKDKHFLKLSKKHPEIDAIQKKLKLLYKHYEQKQELYDELDKIEEGEQEEQSPDKKTSAEGEPEENEEEKKQTKEESKEELEQKPKSESEKEKPEPEKKKSGGDSMEDFFKDS